MMKSFKYSLSLGTSEECTNISFIKRDEQTNGQTDRIASGRAMKKLLHEHSPGVATGLHAAIC